MTLRIMAASKQQNYCELLFLYNIQFGFFNLQYDSRLPLFLVLCPVDMGKMHLLFETSRHSPCEFDFFFFTASDGRIFGDL